MKREMKTSYYFAGFCAIILCLFIVNALWAQTPTPSPGVKATDVPVIDFGGSTVLIGIFVVIGIWFIFRMRKKA